MTKNLFSQFLALFPPSELPVSLTLDSHKTFEQVNDLIPPDLVAHFIMQEDELPEDEFTEYLPCFRLPEATNREYISLVYWKAALMRYDFILATYTRTGIPISRQVIAGTSSDGKTIVRKLATIEPDFSVEIVASEQEADDLHFDPSSTKEISYELLPNGFISQLNEKE